jgi:hypothetical protein
MRIKNFNINTDFLTTLISILGLIATALVTHFDIQNFDTEDLISLVTITLIGFFSNKK